MKKIILILIYFGISSSSFAQDNVYCKLYKNSFQALIEKKHRPQDLLDLEEIDFDKYEIKFDSSYIYDLTVFKELGIGNYEGITYVELDYGNVLNSLQKLLPRSKRKGKNILSISFTRLIKVENYLLLFYQIRGAKCDVFRIQLIFNADRLNLINSYCYYPLNKDCP